MKTIRIKGAVVTNDMKNVYDWMGWDSIAPVDVEKALIDCDENDPVELDISSDGGVVSSATEIYSMLKKHKGTVTVNVQGLAASSATIIAMAGDKVIISPVGQMMIHKASMVTSGNSDDLQADAKALDATDQTIVNAYQLKTGLSRNELLKMMSDTTWLTAQDAVDKGFADEIANGNDDDDKAPLLTNSTHTVMLSSGLDQHSLSKLKNLIDENKSLKNALNESKKNQSTSLLQKKLAILNQK